MKGWPSNPSAGQQKICEEFFCYEAYDYSIVPSYSFCSVCSSRKNKVTSDFQNKLCIPVNFSTTYEHNGGWLLAKYHFNYIVGKNIANEWIYVAVSLKWSHNKWQHGTMHIVFCYQHNGMKVDNHWPCYSFNNQYQASPIHACLALYTYIFQACLQLVS